MEAILLNATKFTVIHVIQCDTPLLVLMYCRILTAKKKMVTSSVFSIPVLFQT